MNGGLIASIAGGIVVVLIVGFYIVTRKDKP